MFVFRYVIVVLIISCSVRTKSEPKSDTEIYKKLEEKIDIIVKDITTSEDEDEDEDDGADSENEVSETYTSFVQLKHLLKTEVLLVEILETFVPAAIQEKDAIKTFILDYKERHVNPVEDEEFLSCPTNAYRLIKKLTHDFRKIVEALGHTFDNHHNEVWNKFRKLLPSYNDIDGAAMALIRIQATYKIDARDMAVGLTSDVCNQWELTADDCFEIGQAAYRAHDFKSALDWFDVTLDILDAEYEEGVDLPEADREAFRYMAGALHQAGQIDVAVVYMKEWLTIDPHNLPAKEMKQLYEKDLQRQENSDDEGSSEEEGDEEFAEDAAYTALCRGENIKTSANLVCRYKHTTPFFHLRPLKEETLSYDPYVATFHDIAVEGEMVQIKEIATKYLTRSAIYNVKEKMEGADYRVSSSAWLGDGVAPELESLSQRIAAAIGLSLETADSLQVRWQ